jgi:hypothetical protein
MAEIPKQSVSCRDSMEIQKYSRPEPDKDDERRVLNPIQMEVIKHFNNCEEKVRDVHRGVYGISYEREVDTVTPARNGDVIRPVRVYVKAGPTQ